MRRKLPLLFLMLLTLLYGGCAFDRVWHAPEPTVVLDAPRQNLAIVLGTPLTVRAHSNVACEEAAMYIAYNAGGNNSGIVPMNLSHDEQGDDPPACQGDAQWVAPAVGQYSLFVELMMEDGQVPRSQAVIITVLAASPEPTPTLSSAPPSLPFLTLTADDTSLAAGECTYLRWSISNLQPQSMDLNGAPVAPQGEMLVCPCATTTYDLIVLAGDKYAQSVTIQVSGSCAAPATPPPATPVVQFWADSTSLQAGSCTFLRWDTTNAAQVYLDGIGVTASGQKQVCLCTPQTYTLDVVGLNGLKYQSVLTINTTGSCQTPTTPPPPQDTTPPPIPTPLSPGNSDPNATPVTAYCPLTLRWQAVSDPSGVTYSVVLQEAKAGGGWTTVGSWNNLTVAQQDISEAKLCDYTDHRWQVRARDGAGNWSNWSPWMYYNSPLP